MFVPTNNLSNCSVCQFDGNVASFTVSDRHVEKESLADFVNKKREMFLVQVRILCPRRVILCENSTKGIMLLFYLKKLQMLMCGILLCSVLAWSEKR